MTPRPSKLFPKWNLPVVILIYTLVVILWGAFVRATGSGAGCGSHWPLCNGDVVPRAPSIETMIEYSHRLMSGVLGFLVLGLVFWARRKSPRLRHGALAVFLITVVESIIGAVLVKYEWVAENASSGRAFVMGLHLVNTLILVGAMTLVAEWSRGTENASIRRRFRDPLWALGFLLFLIVGSTGAITALGDTLFPAKSLLQGFRADLDPTQHFLIRLRVWHPVFACLLALLLGKLALREMTNPFSKWVLIMIGIQISFGFLNLVLLAPVAIQLFHLLMANLLWIVFLFWSLRAPRLASQF